ncbi:hypothetical protein [Euzebya sp.]|uniref:SCO6745 family protein n=1 Tax=Euzebya sp. TaxID=1971409 RepID=UPI00351444AE
MGVATDDRGARAADALWRVLEPYHAVTYFASEHREACDALGLRGGWMAYFASRAAPLGPVAPEVVTALFHGFSPPMVARSLPDAWTHASPAAVLDARAAGVDTALRRVLGAEVEGEGVMRAADLARRLATAPALAGRPMHAANRSLPWPDAPHMVLWHAATLLREHRGDGHVAVLVGAGLDGCAAQVLQVATGRVPRSVIQPARWWTDEEWDVAVESLRGRGLVDAGGAATADGVALRDRMERQTSTLAAEPVRRVGVDVASSLVDAMGPVVDALARADIIPYPNAMGVPSAGEGVTR